MGVRTIASEADTLTAIKDLLAAMRIPSFRMNSGAFPVDYETKKGEKKRRFIRFGERGMADLVAFPVPPDSVTMSADPDDHHYQLPLVLWIETKAPGGRQSDHQKAFQKYVEERGMFYLVAWDAEDVYNWLKARGVR